VPTDAPPAAAQAVTVPANGRGTDSAPDSPDTLVVTVGASVVVRIPGVSRVAIGDPSVADLEPMRDGVKLLGKSRGYTNLLIWTRLGQTFRKVHVK
jgi:pilus assembly protein CpaC